MIAAATTEGADVDPVVSRAVATASAGPYLVAAMGFAALLAAAGLLTLRSGVFARWTGIVALIGAVSFLITFLALIAGHRRRQRVRLRLLPGVLALVIWSIATSIATSRAVATSAREFVAQYSARRERRTHRPAGALGANCARRAPCPRRLSSCIAGG